jgi:hypothetical protein
MVVDNTIGNSSTFNLLVNYGCEVMEGTMNGFGLSSYIVLPMECPFPRFIHHPFVGCAALELISASASAPTSATRRSQSLRRSIVRIYRNS